LIDEIIETAVPWGAFAALGALVGAAFPRETRKVSKKAIRAALRITDWAREAGSEAYEKGLDVVAEARLEHEQASREAENRRLRVVTPTEVPPRARRTTRTTAGSRRASPHKVEASE
jgi:hypothetical protein